MEFAAQVPTGPLTTTLADVKITLARQSAYHRGSRDAEGFVLKTMIQADQIDITPPAVESFALQTPQ
jgi:hypothetical protein